MWNLKKWYDDLFLTNQLNDMEEQISDPEDRIMEITQSDQQTKK